MKETEGKKINRKYENNIVICIIIQNMLESNMI